LGLISVGDVALGTPGIDCVEDREGEELRLFLADCPIALKFLPIPARAAPIPAGPAAGCDVPLDLLDFSVISLSVGCRGVG
jgi:hypothetical protein